MNSAIVLLQASIGLMALWALWQFGWKQYQLEQLRQKLFCARDDLFLQVAKGEIPILFEDEIYKEWRGYFNAAIRYCHCINLNRPLFAGLLSKLPIWGTKVELKNFRTSAEVALEKIENEDVKKRILEFRMRSVKAFCWYLFTTSPIFAVGLILTVFLVVSVSIFQVGIENLSTRVKKKVSELSEEPIRVMEAEAEICLPSRTAFA
jgi:hypothetical protein